VIVNSGVTVTFRPDSRWVTAKLGNGSREREFSATVVETALTLS
jgi:hypothetical protein